MEIGRGDSVEVGERVKKRRNRNAGLEEEFTADIGVPRRIVPAWVWQPGVDVSDVPPPGLVNVQHIAKEAAASGLAAAAPGVSEQDVEAAVNACLSSRNVSHVWTVTNVGLGKNAHICFPTHPPTATRAAGRDVLIVDVHPIASDGFWGDCTRCAVIGDYPQARQTLADLEAIHYETLRKCVPGMQARELFTLYADRLKKDGYLLLDKLGNVGHSLTAGAAYLHQFIDADNTVPMWGAWAVEPFAARDDIAVKVEDVVWFGRERCTII